MIKILGTGQFAPQHVLTNQDLEKIVDTTDEWITKRTGIKERKVVTTESVADMATQAGLQAILKAGCTPRDIDMIVCSTIGGDYVVPPVACLVAGQLGLTVPALDINAACSGFVYALDVVATYLQSGRVDRVLLIGVDNLSRFVDYNDRNTCVLFGDGAGALVLAKGQQLKSIKLTTQGSAELMNIPNTSGNAPFMLNRQIPPYLIMHGQEVYKWAVSKIEHEVRAVVQMAGVEMSDVDWLLPHQANYRIIETAAKSLGLDMSQVVNNIECRGNTSSACIPTLLSIAFDTQLFRPGSIVVLCAFGAGLTTGAAVIKV
ncbi:MAG: ketoacyl-ACP synthase III [Clostridiales bacterium]|jgi:3-oxoacyl-[acyl-carrier-protein] synthase-3|nr:ketoacyl-ACP synthase III [Clostridiales bacterium]